MSSNQDDERRREDEATADVSGLCIQLPPIQDLFAGIAGPLPFREATAPLAQHLNSVFNEEQKDRLLADIEDSYEFGMARAAREGEPLTAAEAAALHLYSGVSVFRPMNAYLRDSQRTADNIAPFAPFIWLMLHAMKKCPVNNEARTVYRGVKIIDGNIDPTLYREGVVFTWGAFTSCASSITTLNCGEFAGEEGEKVVFSLEQTTTRGRNIAQYSKFPKEREVLFPANMRLLVIGCARFRDSWLVQLRELDCLEPLLEYGERLSGAAATVQEDPTANMCADCTTATATIWCATCLINFCAPCDARQHRLGTNATHIRGEVSNRLQMACSKHGRELDFFCGIDQCALCPLCCRSAAHKGHDTDLCQQVLSEVMDEYRGDTRKLMSELHESKLIAERFGLDINSTIQRLATDSMSVSLLSNLEAADPPLTVPSNLWYDSNDAATAVAATTLGAAEALLDEEFRKIIQAAYARRSLLRSELRAQAKSKLAKLSAQLQLVDIAIGKAVSILYRAETAVNSFSDHQFAAAYKELKNGLKSALDELAGIKKLVISCTSDIVFSVSSRFAVYAVSRAGAFLAGGGVRSNIAGNDADSLWGAYANMFAGPSN